MPTDPVPKPAPRLRPTAEIAALRRQVWLSAMFMAWGAFELGRWLAAAEPWHFSPVFRGCLGTLMVVSAVFGLRVTLRQIGAASGGDAPAR
jgi:hypothetical protein